MAIDPTRAPRELETREAAMRDKPWQPASILPDPEPKEGVSYRWIRSALMGQNDPTNVSAMFREGWEPVPAHEQPKLAELKNLKGNIEIGGLILCRMPTEQVEARRDYYKNMTEAQVRAVDNNFMNQSKDPRMPLFNENKSVTKFGKGATKA
jgi:hypothetical protein